MRKVVIALLVVAIVGLSACIGNASWLDSYPDRYYRQNNTHDGNVFYVDRKSIRHYKDAKTEYIGIIEIDQSSDLYKTSCKQVESTKTPVFVASSIMLDCVNARFQTRLIAILAVEKAKPEGPPEVVWQKDFSNSEWAELPSGGIEKGMKALLCGPSF